MRPSMQRAQMFMADSVLKNGLLLTGVNLRFLTGVSRL
ncbi:hypothetical protein SAMN05216236_13112 [Sedimentitalea nanhaiensis]|uniref:Uncharacterized protein n=1 Tax=Sedimentitalea nanhaiensis TaxID=999627 RepID=A0A1I7DMX8_9RHOB|nr:hypothetical protein SAMN05216236_13112 [Sedimentitalea nanhaiensis]